ncbi:permease, partial [Clostridium sporogenes]|nr:permease [Clostridium sporogenes]
KKGAKFSNIMIFMGAWCATKIPTFLFELSALGYKYTSAFMFVGIVTFSMEAKFIGKKATFIRNIVYFFYSILSAFIVGILMR